MAVVPVVVEVLELVFLLLQTSMIAPNMVNFKAIQLAFCNPNVDSQVLEAYEAH